MSDWICPHCGSTVAGAMVLPGQTVSCPACAGSVGPAKAESGNPDRGSSAPIGAGGGPWSRSPPVPAANPWSSVPPPTANPWSERPDDSRVDLPFNPLAELPHGAKRSPSLRRLIHLLTGLAVFLAALIGAVLAARQLRPLVGRSSVSIGSATFDRWVRELGDKERQQQAARAIVAEGPEVLMAALDRISKPPDGEDQTFTMTAGMKHAFADVGPEAAGVLGAALSSPKVNVRLAAASVLCEMGPDARGAQDGLLAATADQNRLVRSRAIEALGYLGVEGTSVVDALLPLLEHSVAPTRRSAVEALGCIGPDAQAALPALKQLQQQDFDRGVRQALSAALLQINIEHLAAEGARQADPSVRALIRKLQGGDPAAGATAAKELGQMGGKAATAIPALALAVRSKDAWRREAAARALGDLGLLARDYLPSLRVAARDPDPQVRRAADEALEQIEGK